jgi:hypothetical protein
MPVQSFIEIATVTFFQFGNQQVDVDVSWSLPYRTLKREDL